MRNNILIAATAMIAPSAAAAQRSRAKREQMAQATTGGNAARGLAAIARYGCGSCHIIPGVSGASAGRAAALGHRQPILRCRRIAKHAAEHGALD